MTCLILGCTYGDISFQDYLAEIEDPRAIEVIHGLVFVRKPKFEPPTYEFTGARAEWKRPKVIRTAGRRWERTQTGEGPVD